MGAAGKYRVLSFSDDEPVEPVRVEVPQNDEVPRMISLAELQGQTPPPPPAATRRVRPCAQGRARASRGRAVRVRGSRRSTAAAHASSSDDPGLGDEPPGHRPLRTGAAG
jgi:hypothetical protein